MDNRPFGLPGRGVTGCVCALLFALVASAGCQSDSKATLPPIVTPTPAPSPTTTALPSALAAECQRTVEAMRELARGLELPKHFMEEEAVKRGEEFDVNTYFDVLDHLAVRPGFTLDYVYQYDGTGGRPVMYARPEAQPPYATFTEYYNSMPGELTRDERLEVSWYGHMDQIQVDGTEEGFFQFVALRIIGNQFYLFWHSNYNDDLIVCDRQELEEIVARISKGNPEIALSPELQQEARALNPEPRVEMADDRVQVRVVTFSMWGGFAEETYVFSRSFPHQLMEENFDRLVPYDCGIMF